MNLQLVLAFSQSYSQVKVGFSVQDLVVITPFVSMKKHAPREVLPMPR